MIWDDWVKALTASSSSAFGSTTEQTIPDYSLSSQQDLAAAVAALHSSESELGGRNKTKKKTINATCLPSISDQSLLEAAAAQIRQTSHDDKNRYPHFTPLAAMQQVLEAGGELQLERISNDDRDYGNDTMIRYKVSVTEHPHLALLMEVTSAYETANRTIDASSRARPNNSLAKARFYLDAAHEFALLQRLTNDSTEDVAILLPYSCQVYPPPSTPEDNKNQQPLRKGTLLGCTVRLMEWVDYKNNRNSSSSSSSSSTFASRFVGPPQHPSSSSSLLCQQLAPTLARLHNLRGVDRNLMHHMNTRRTSLADILPRGGSLSNTTNLGCEATTHHSKRVQNLLNELGEQTCSVMTGAMINDYHRADCLIHNDANLLNVRVVSHRRRPSAFLSKDESEDLSSSHSQDDSCAFTTNPTTNEEDEDHEFDDKNNVSLSSLSIGSQGLRPSTKYMNSSTSFRDRLIIPDWTTVRPGPRGRDLGLVLGWPLACLLFQSSTPSSAAVTNVQEEPSETLGVDLANLIVRDFWDAYLQECRTMATSDLIRLYKNMMGWCGWLLYVHFYQKQKLVSDLFHFATPTDRMRVMESIGVVGLQCMHVGFAPSDRKKTSKTTSLYNSLEKVQAHFLKLIQNEQKYLHRSSSAAAAATITAGGAATISVAPAPSRLSLSLPTMQQEQEHKHHHHHAVYSEPITLMSVTLSLPSCAA